MRRLTCGPARFLLLSRISLGLVVANVATGAAVRLSDSGLGCPDWPTCARQRFTPPLSLHPVVEFGNRMVVAVLMVSLAATLVAAVSRTPRRRDLVWLSAGLVAGVVGEAVMGAVVVYTKLNPYVVMTHFLLGMVLLAAAAVLALRAGHAGGRGTPAVPHRVTVLSRAFLAMVAVVLAAGSATTGAGPHAGGKGAKRIPVALSTMARTHAELALATGALLLFVLWTLWRSDAPAAVQDRGRWVLVVMVGQGVVGYTQYFTHLPAVLVGIHVVGATMVLVVALWFHHGLSDHAPEQAGETGAGGGEAARRGAATSGAGQGTTGTPTGTGGPVVTGAPAGAGR